MSERRSSTLAWISEGRSDITEVNKYCLSVNRSLLLSLRMKTTCWGSCASVSLTHTHCSSPKLTSSFFPFFCICLKKCFVLFFSPLFSILFIAPNPRQGHGDSWTWINVLYKSFESWELTQVWEGELMILTQHQNWDINATAKNQGFSTILDS